LSWLPPPPKPREASGRAWAPEGLDAPAADLRYVVVEEILRPSVTLSISEWPEVDSAGRLVFSGATRTATVDRDEVEAVLRSRRRLAQGHRGDAGEARAAAQRPISVGDVYAARVAYPRRGPLPRSAESLLRQPIIDLSAEAREAAQAAALAAVTTTLSPRRASRLLDLRDDPPS